MAKKRPIIIENILIEDIGAEGKAIARHNDMVVFIPYAIPGDIVDIRLGKKRRNYAEGSVITTHKYSDKRVEADCPHFGNCGGCKWQTLDYKYQIEAKEKQVLDALNRIAHIDIDAIEPILGSSEIYYYRNKLEYTFSNRRWLSQEEINSDEKLENWNSLGFHVPRFYDKVINIEHCSLQRDPSNSIRNYIREYGIDNDIDFFDIRQKTGLLRNLIIRTTDSGELMVILVSAQMDDSIMLMLDSIREKFPEITSLMYCINDKANDTIFDRDIILHSGREYIIEKMSRLDNEAQDFDFRIGPKSFYQTNSAQAYRLYKRVAELAGLEEGDIVYDLYTGTGTIANFVSPYVGKVIGIEYIEEAIQDARINSKINNIDNTVFYSGDIAKVLDRDFVEKNGRPDIIITDPPRAGMHPKVIEQLIEIGAKRLVYVSCNPATQARDVEMLSQRYRIDKVQPVDMFPHTHHVENIIALSLKE